VSFWYTLSDGESYQWALFLIKHKEFSAANDYLVMLEQLSDYKDSSPYLSMLAFCESELGNEEDALKHIEQALILDENNPKLYNILGAIYDKNGQISKAIASLQKACKLAPNSVIYYAHLGYISRKNGKIREALNAYQKLTEWGEHFTQHYVVKWFGTGYRDAGG